jgi:hypothetical protein
VIEEFPAPVRMQLLPSPEASESAAAEAPTASLFEQSLEPDQKAVFEVLRADEALFVIRSAARSCSPSHAYWRHYSVWK